MEQRKKLQILKGLLYVILVGYALLTFYPFIWAVAASFKPYSEIVSGDMGLIPKEFTLENFQYVLGRSSMFTRWFINSVVISVIGTAINILLNTMAGYALARLNFPGRQRIYYGFLSLMMVPAQVLLIPCLLYTSPSPRD